MIDNSLTVSKQNLSLPHIAYMYAANDFQTYSINTSDAFEDNLHFQKQLKLCIQEVLSSDTNSAKDSMAYLNQQINYPNYVQPSPCKNISRYPKCGIYCNWHDSYFEQ